MSGHLFNQSNEMKSIQSNEFKFLRKTNILTPPQSPIQSDFLVFLNNLREN